MKLFCCITFHYKDERIKYLIETINGVSEIQTEKTEICIITNTNISHEIEKIEKLIKFFDTNKFKISINTFNKLINPWFLTWVHKSLMANKFLENEFSHFLCLEDDIRMTNFNICYWLEYREELRSEKLYPSFLRVERKNNSNQWVSTDVTKPISLKNKKTISIENKGIAFINSPQPYQGMFFYDNELMKEHLQSVTANVKDYGLLEFVDVDPSWPGGGVAERANLALTYHNVPNGYTSRNVLPYNKYFALIDHRCLIHHTPNNYANEKPNSLFGKISISDLLTD